MTSTAASVGPYRFSSRAEEVRKNRSRSSADNASPLHTTSSRLGQSAEDGSSRNTSSIDGTKCATVIRSARIRSARYRGSR